MNENWEATIWFIKKYWDVCSVGAGFLIICFGIFILKFFCGL